MAELTPEEARARDVIWLRNNYELADTPEYNVVMDRVATPRTPVAAEDIANIPDLTGGISAPSSTTVPDSAPIELNTRYEPVVDDKMSYEQASIEDKVSEILRRGAWGAEAGFEGFADLGDIMMSPIDQFLPYAWGGPAEGEDIAFLNSINPWGAPDRGDIARQEMLYDQPAWVNATEERISRGDAPWLFNAAKTGAEYVLPTSGGGLLSKGKRLVTDLPTVLRREGRDILQNTVTTSGGAGFGEQGGQAIGEYLGGEDMGQMAGETGEIISSMFAPWAIRSGLSKFGNRDNLTTEQARDATARFILANVEDPDEFVTSIQNSLRQGDEGTLASLGGDPFPYNLEEAVPQGSRLWHERSNIDTGRRSQQTEEIAQNWGEADPVSIFPQAAQQRASRIADVEGSAAERVGEVGTENLIDQANLQSNLDEVNRPIPELQQALDDALETIHTDTPRSQTSRAFYNAYEDFEAGLKEVADGHWDDFRGFGPINTTGVSGELNAIIEGLAPSMQRRVKDAYGDELNDIMKLGDNATPDEMWSIVSDIKRKFGNAQNADKVGGTDKFVSKLSRQFENIIEQSEAGPTYIKARDATHEQFARSHPGLIGEARRTASNRGTRSRQDIPEMLGGQLEFKGGTGAGTARNILESGSEEVIDSATNQFRSYAKDMKIDDAFMNEHEDFLMAFPELQAEYNLARIARNNLDEGAALQSSVQRQVAEESAGLNQAAGRAASDIQSQAAGDIKDIEQSITGIFANDPVKARTLIDRAIKSDEPTQLMAIVDELGNSPEAMESLKAIVGQQFMRQITDGSGIIDPSRVQNFNKLKGHLQRTGLMGEDEISLVGDLLEGVDHEAALRRFASVEGAHKNGMWVDLVSSAIGAAALKFSPVNNLIMGSAVRRAVKNMITHADDPRIKSTLEDMVKNPELLLPHLEKFKDMPDGMTKGQAIVNSILTGAGMPAAVVNLQDDDQFQIFKGGNDAP